MPSSKDSVGSVVMDTVQLLSRELSMKFQSCDNIIGAGEVSLLMKAKMWLKALVSCQISLYSFFFVIIAVLYFLYSIILYFCMHFDAKCMEFPCN